MVGESMVTGTVQTGGTPRTSALYSLTSVVSGSSARLVVPCAVAVESPGLAMVPVDVVACFDNLPAVSEGALGDVLCAALQSCYPVPEGYTETPDVGYQAAVASGIGTSPVSSGRLCMRWGRFENIARLQVPCGRLRQSPKRPGHHIAGEVRRS